MPLLYPAFAEINRVYRTVVRDGDGNGVIELALAISFGAEACHKRPVRGELLNPMVVEVGRENVPFLIDSHAGHRREPAAKRAVRIPLEKGAFRDLGLHSSPP